jgi:hypothetical protein
MLLAPKESMERIAEAIRKIQKHAGELAKASASGSSVRLLDDR